MEKRDTPCCEEAIIHADTLMQVKSLLPEDEVLYDLAELFKIFGDSTRVKILYALLEAELCVCDIAETLNMTQSAISHQLRVLRSARLVKATREGRSVFYTLDDDHVARMFEQGLIHVTE